MSNILMFPKNQNLMIRRGLINKLSEIEVYKSMLYYGLINGCYNIT